MIRTSIPEPSSSQALSQPAPARVRPPDARAGQSPFVELVRRHQRKFDQTRKTEAQESRPAHKARVGEELKPEAAERIGSHKPGASDNARTAQPATRRADFNEGPDRANASIQGQEQDGSSEQANAESAEPGHTESNQPLSVAKDPESTGQQDAVDADANGEAGARGWAGPSTGRQQHPAADTPDQQSQGDGADEDGRPPTPASTASQPKPIPMQARATVRSRQVVATVVPPCSTTPNLPETPLVSAQPGTTDCDTSSTPASDASHPARHAAQIGEEVVSQGAAASVPAGLPPADSTEDSTIGEAIGPALRVPGVQEPVLSAPAATHETRAVGVFKLSTVTGAVGTQFVRTGAHRSDAAPDAAQFEAIVARGLAAAIQQKGGSVVLRLQPETLGQVRIMLDLSPGQVSVRLAVGSAEARDLLNESLPSLRSSLQGRGLAVEHASVFLDRSLAGPEGSQHRSGTGGTDQQPRHGYGGPSDGGGGSGSWSGGQPARQDAGSDTDQGMAGGRPTPSVERQAEPETIAAANEGGAPSVVMLRLDAVA